MPPTRRGDLAMASPRAGAARAKGAPFDLGAALGGHVDATEDPCSTG